nr:hypothetical protein [Tanacetum cinerariifolium]
MKSPLPPTMRLLYLAYPNSEYFEIVSHFISKCYLKKAFARAPKQYVEYLAEFCYTAKTIEGFRIWVSTPTGGIRGEIGVNTFRNAIKANYLNEYVASPSLTIVRPWFSSISLYYFHSDSASGCDASTYSIAEADPRIYGPKNFIPEQHDQTKYVGNGLKTTHTDLAFLTLNSPQEEPIIVLDENEEEETERYKRTHTTSHNEPEDTSIQHPPSPKSVQIQELMLTELLVTSLKPEITKLLASYDFVSYLPTELKELLLKITKLSGDVNELKKHVRDMEIEQPEDLKEIPKKLETFTSIISSKSNASPTKGEKNTYSATKKIDLKNDLVDLMGIDVVEEYHKKKLLYDKYYEKTLNRRKSHKITNYDVQSIQGR